MFAVLAAFAFAVALVLHIVGAGHVEVAMIIGDLCIALHLAFGWPVAVPWRRA